MAIEEIKKIKCTCERCGFIWVPRKAMPMMCPECKSPYWNKPRKEENEE